MAADLVNTLTIHGTAEDKINERLVGQLTILEGARLLDGGLIELTSST